MISAGVYRYMASKDIFFYKESEKPYGCFSNFYQPCTIIDNGTTYTSSEQHFMASKARYFNDNVRLQEILAENNPAKVKKLGRVVSGFNTDVWSKVADKYMLDALRLKFTQNAQLRDILLGTKDAMLYEASPNDRIWGIGYNAVSAQANRATWGENRLGKALMTVRKELLAKTTPAPTDPKPDPKAAPIPDPAVPVKSLVKQANRTNTAAASSANNSANTDKKNIDDYKDDIVDIYGKLYYLGDILTKKDLRQMNRQLKNAEYVLEPKFPIIYTLHDFISEYIHNTNAKTNADVIEDTIELCKKYLQLGKTYIKDSIKDGKNIKVDTEREKELLSYILTTRQEQMKSERTNTIVSLHGRSYLQLHDSIIANIKSESSSQAAQSSQNTKKEGELLTFLLFYVWLILQKKGKQLNSNDVKKSWNESTSRLTWNEMIQKVSQSSMVDVINAIAYINSSAVSEISKSNTNTENNIKMHITEILKIIEGISATTVDAADSDTNSIDTAIIALYDENEESIINQSGGSLLHPSFFIQALQPIMHYLHMNHSIYSFITDIVPSYNIIGDMQQLHHICSSITNEKQYGFYRIKHIPSELFTHIQQLIDCSITYTSHNGTHYSASHCNTDGDYLYFLCLDGNIAFTDDVTEKKQIKEQTAVRTFFQEKTLYLLYSPKKEVRMSNYMRDPYYVYDINYDDINHDTHQIRIRNIDTLLNKQDVPLGNYLTVESKKLVDICQLELSLIHQLNHLIVV